MGVSTGSTFQDLSQFIKIIYKNDLIMAITKTIKVCLKAMDKQFVLELNFIIVSLASIVTMKNEQ